MEKSGKICIMGKCYKLFHTKLENKAEIIEKDIFFCYFLHNFHDIMEKVMENWNTLSIEN